jgi:hypothetical protein
MIRCPALLYIVAVPTGVCSSCTKLFRKDRTLVEILDSLRRLETKVDQITTHGSQSSAGSKAFGLSIATNSPIIHESESSPSTPSQQFAFSATNTSQGNRQNPTAHKILTWPVMQELTLQSLPSDLGNMNNYKRNGATFLIQLSHSLVPLAVDNELQTIPFAGMVGITTHILLSGLVSGFVLKGKSYADLICVVAANASSTKYGWHKNGIPCIG